jgi:ubiquitin-conjugating enzyme E2 G1
VRAAPPASPPCAVYNDGKVCISILHDAGVDRYNAQETADERWRPILGVEQILISVMSMLSEPNADSPANVDAAKMYRENEKEFRRKVRRTVERTLE